MTDKGASYLRRLRKLRSLDFDGNKTTEGTLIKLIMNIPQLLSLTASKYELSKVPNI